MARRRGGGGRWTSLHESTSVSPPLLTSLYSIPLSIFFTSYTNPLHRLYHLYILHHFALCTFQTHTHTHKHKNTILHYPSTQAQEHYMSLHSPHQQHKNTFLLDTD